MPEPISQILTDPMAEFVDSPGCHESVPPRKADTYRVRPDMPEAKRALSGVDGDLRALLRELTAGKKPWPLFLHGPVGAGKTSAAVVACDLREFARYWTVGDVLDMVGKKNVPWDWSRTPRLTVLDEIGTRNTSIDARGRFEYDMVKKFTDWRDNRPAIYISNHTLGTLGTLYDRRIASRLGAGTVYFLNGPDRRLQDDGGER